MGRAPPAATTPSSIRTMSASVDEEVISDCGDADIPVRHGIVVPARTVKTPRMQLDRQILFAGFARAVDFVFLIGHYCTCPSSFFCLASYIFSNCREINIEMNSP